MHAIEDKHNKFGVWDIALRAEGHVYSVTNTTTGHCIQGGIGSVTTFIHSMFPQFDPVSVVGRMRAATKASKYSNMSDANIMQYWADNGRHAAELGTEMHSTVEAYLRTIIDNGWPGQLPMCPPARPWLVDPRWPQNLGDETGIIVDMRHLEHFRAYMDKHKLRPIAVEKCMFNQEARLAGTVDALFRNTVTGEILLYDWKRRSEFTVDNPWQSGLDSTPVAGLPDCHMIGALLQLNMYRRMLCEGDGFGNEKLVVARMHIISFHPSLPTFMDHEIPIDDGLTDLVWNHRLDKVRALSLRPSIPTPQTI